MQRNIANAPPFVITAKLFSVARYVAHGLKFCRKTGVRDLSDKKRLLAVQQEAEEREEREERRFARLTANEGGPPQRRTVAYHINRVPREVHVASESITLSGYDQLGR